jgi:hypothetical protein
MDKKKRNYIIVAALLGIVFAYAAWPGLWWSLAKSFNREVSVGPLAAKDVEGWKTYIDQEFGFQFKYPDGFEAIDNFQYPVAEGAVKEIVVQKSGTRASSELFFTVDLFEAESVGVGGIAFSLNGEPGSIGCTYNGGACRIYLEKRNALVLVKISPYPWSMIDSDARKSLATLKFSD